MLAFVGPGFGTSPASAAVGIDMTSTGTTTGASINISHTTSGSDRLMLVGVSIAQAGVETVSSITYNGGAQSLSPRGSINSPGGQIRVEIWSLVAPDPVTADVVVNFSNPAADGAMIGVMTFTGVDQTTPLGAFAPASADSGGSASVDVSSAVGELVFGVVGVDDGTDYNLAPGPGQTPEEWDLAINEGNGGGSTEAGAAPTVTTSWTWPGNDEWAVAGISIKPGNCPGGVVTTTVDSTTGGSLRACIIWANGNAGADTVIVPAGTYNLTLGALDVTDQLTVTGAGEATTIVDGQALDRVFDIAAGITANLSGLTVRNGNIVGFAGGIRNAGDLTLTNVTLRDNVASASGGAIRSQGATTSLTLTNVTITNNTAGNRGGGIYLQTTGATLVMTGGSISDNTATNQGGGIYNDTTSATLNNVTVSGNVGSNGGGIFSDNPGSTLTVTDSTFSSNQATVDDGGAIMADAGVANINSSTFNANTALRDGGAIMSKDATTSLVNITVSGNSAARFGGGATINGGTLSVTNVTITNNSALTNGGGLHVSAGVGQLLNTIVANSTSGGDCSGTITDLGNNLDTDGTCPVGFLTAPPLLGPLANNGGPTFTHELLAGSPAIDAGTNTGCPATDQRGVARPVNVTCDIGAYEAEPDPLEIVKRAFETDGTPIPTGSTIPNFLEFKYLLYINNKGIATSDVSVRDVLAAAFQYQTGTIQVDNSVVECALTVCTAAEELTIFTAVDGAAFLTDAVDGDVASYTGATTTVDAGNQNVANAQLNINADAVWAILFSLKMP